MIEILVEGDEEAAKRKADRKYQFKCDDCGCVWNADKNEYSWIDERDTYPVCTCPCCKKKNVKSIQEVYLSPILPKNRTCVNCRRSGSGNSYFCQNCERDVMRYGHYTFWQDYRMRDLEMGKYCGNCKHYSLVSGINISSGPCRDCVLGFGANDNYERKYERQ